MIKRSITGTIFLTALGLGTYSVANGKSKSSDWRQKRHCVKLMKAETPTMMNSKDIKFIGVDISSEGAIKRLYPKPDTFKSLPDNFVFDHQAKFLDGLTRDDFFHYTGPYPENYETPLDIHSSDDASFIYILLPESWTFSYPAMTMKLPPKKWTRPHFDFPTRALTSKIAVVHRQGMTTDLNQNCDYKFNLHVTITQDEGGRIFKTPIIIDLGGNNSGHGIP